MNIVFILPGNGRSGGVKVTVDAANHLLDRGHGVRILYKQEDRTIRSVLKSIFFPIIYACGWIDKFKGRTDIFREVHDGLFEKDELIIGAGMWSSSQLTRLDSTRNKKLQYLHGEHIVNPKRAEKVFNFPIPKIVVSSFLRPLVERCGGNVLDVIPNGIDQGEYYNTADSGQKDGVGAIYASHVAKAPEVMLAVLKKISQIKPEVPVRIFGPHRRPQGLNRSSFCRLPSIEKARDIYSSSLVWIVASRSEGFSIPVLEAMACGCAVVATDCGGTRDIIRDGENGFLAEVGNVDQIVDRALMLLDDSSLRERMCKRASETVKEFTWDRSIDKLENVLENL